MPVVIGPRAFYSVRLAVSIALLAASPPALVVSGCGPSKEPASASTSKGGEQEEIASMLDDWHEAAAKAEEARYFSHFAPDALFIGTDPAERWDLEAFRKYASPRFASGKAWTMKSTRRAITVAPSGDIAWFDEDLTSKGMGAVRGSGVVQRGGAKREWRIVQYNLSVPIPNEVFDKVKKLIERE